MSYARSNVDVMEAGLAQAERALDGALGAPTWPLTDSDVRGCLAAAFALVQAATAVTARLAREAAARGLPTHDGATSPAVWLRSVLRTSVHDAKRIADLGDLLHARPALADALAQGRANTEQVRAIAAVLDDLPRDCGPETVERATGMLVRSARQFEPSVLRGLGARILAHVDPDAADRTAEEAAERRYRRARTTRTFTLTDLRDGRTRVTGWLDAEAAATVRKAVDALSKPLPADDRNAGQRRADALADICRQALAGGTLPDTGGDPPQLTVTVDYDVLRRELGSGVLDTGERLTPAQVRRLACDARILPAVLDGDGIPLDLGRSRRLFTGPLRRAIILRDRGCAFPGCDRPPEWCQVHHIVAWSRGGSTDLGNAALLCGYHHRLVHHADWHIRLGRDRRPEFIPPAGVDPRQVPLSNPYHRRT